MTNQVSILKDYKGREIRPRSRRRVAAYLPGLAAFVIAACWLFAQNEKPAAGIPGPEAAGAQTALHYSPAPEAAAHIQGAAYQPERDAPAGLQHAADPPRPAPLTDLAPAGANAPSMDTGAEETEQPAPRPVAAPLSEAAAPDLSMARPGMVIEPPARPQNWRPVQVKSGDNLALIFSRLGLGPALLHHIMSLGGEVGRLKKLRPGQLLKFNIEAGELLGLEYEIDLTRTLQLTKETDSYSVKITTQALRSVVRQVNQTITDSLFLSGQRAGLSDNLIMQLAAIYAWDIDFALDIRAGDAFSLIYEEQYKDGVKVAEGPVLAAEFINRNRPLRAARYVHADGRADYYSATGEAMRKAFLRTPVNFTRISSRFNPRRLHPILNKIRPHRGIDYAAPIGTPVKATADGAVVLAGSKSGYGKTIILRHGGRYSTVYAHLSRYARGIRAGRPVKQGQTIGYVGQTGLSTGPHLHYEFRIDGVHRNPLTVELPRAESIDKKLLPAFLASIAPVMAQLDRLSGQALLAAQEPAAAAPGPPGQTGKR